LIVYSQGSVRHTASIPVGGDHFTNDIAVGLRTTIPEAERVKRSWGDSTPDYAAGAVLEVPSVGERPARFVGYTMLRDIIEPRAIELLELIQAELERSGQYKQLGAGLMMVGGGAKLGGLVALAEQALGLPVRLGSCTGLENMEDDLTAPDYATVVGLALYGNRRRLLQDSKKPGLFTSFWEALRGKGGAS
jgi:cell division protein FtsA